MHSRTLHFKDGRFQRDERVEHPRDAAADLRARCRRAALAETGRA